MPIPSLRLAGQWRQLRGAVYGLPQPAVIGTIEVLAIPPGAVASIAQVLRALTGVEPPAYPDNAEGLASQLAWLVGAIQRAHRIPVSEHFHLEPVGGGEPLSFRVALPSHAFAAARYAVRWAGAAVNRAIEREPGEADILAMRQQAEKALRPFAEPGLNRFEIIRAAMRLGIPFHARAGDRVIVLGTGCRARGLLSTITDRTSGIGVGAAKMKHFTARILGEAGLPGARNEVARTVEEAIAAAARLGYPVVVKPADQEQGRGVAADLRDAPAVAAAFAAASEVSKTVLVEKWVPGFTHRLTVFGDRLLRVTRRVGGGVVGDGMNDVATLLEQDEAHPLREQMVQLHGRDVLAIDDEALGLLQQDGRDASYVPAAGEYVRLRRRDNISSGGRNEELDPGDPRQVHPDNVRLAIDASRVIGLDLAGVDLIIEDIARSWFGTPAVICEINAQPQIGRPATYDELLPALLGPVAVVPASLFIAPAGEHEELAETLVRSGRFHAVAQRRGLRVAGRIVSAPFRNGSAAARAVLMRNDVESVACVVSPEDIVAYGLPPAAWQSAEVVGIGWTPQERAMLDTAAAMAGCAREAAEA